MARTRRGRIVSTGLLMALVIGGLVATNYLRPTGRPDSEILGTTPIRRVVVIMKENHAFDNYFGTFPGVDGIPRAVSLPDGRVCTVSTIWINQTWTQVLPQRQTVMV